MTIRIVLITIFCLINCQLLIAQETAGLHSAIREMSKEPDPAKCVATMDRLVKEFHLDNRKDSETIDLLNGTVAVAFARVKKYAEFETYIGRIQNKFNQTSMLSMAANELLDQKIDAAQACRIAKETIDRYDSYRNDPAARPAGYTPEDWQRFMEFAKYPYYDTYAKSLFALKRFSEAIDYQRMAFDGPPEDGLPESVERYARLLELTGKPDEARQLLLSMARKGKLNQGMTDQLQSLTKTEDGRGNKGINIDSLQKNVLPSLIKELRPKMLHETAPDFTLKDLDGKAVRLSDFRGKIVILDLWATWCVPCKASFPAMQKQVEKYPDVVFLFIAVNEKGEDARERVKKYITQNKFPFHVLMDEPIAPGAKLFKIIAAYKPDGIPAKYFIDPKGQLRFKSKGFSTDSELINEMDAMIAILREL